MKAYQLYVWLGRLSVCFGILALISLFRIQWLLPGTAASFLGFSCGVIQLIIQQRHAFTQYKWPLAYWGMFLSSLPVLFILFVVFKMNARS